jgi:hypothetical protein
MFSVKFGINAMSIKVGSQFQEATPVSVCERSLSNAAKEMWPHPDVPLSLDCHAVWRAA